MNFTFIIPHKNIPNLLRRCVKSIPHDDDVQIIVVDDNSDEKYQKALQALNEEDANLRLIHLSKSESRGAGHARNVGMKDALGKWIFFADSDDYYLSEIEKLLNVIRSGKYDKTDIVYFPISADKNNTYSWLLVAFESYRNNQNEYLLRYNTHVPWARVVKKKLIEKNNVLFDETQWGNDTAFAAKVGYYAQSIDVYDLPIYYWSYLKTSLSHSDTAESMKCRIGVLYNLTKWLTKRNVAFSSDYVFFQIDKMKMYSYTQYGWCNLKYGILLKRWDKVRLANSILFSQMRVFFAIRTRLKWLKSKHTRQ